MEILRKIHEKIKTDQYEYSRHALDQSILRNLPVKEIKEALLSGIELIEEYPDDFYGPSRLVLGFTEEKKPIHIVCSHPSRGLVKIITVYIPDEKSWKNFRIRL